MKKKPFRRTSYGHPNVNTTDERGTVRVAIYLRKDRCSGGSSHKKGNITKSIGLQEAKVSEVFAAIEKALFDE